MTEPKIIEVFSDNGDFSHWHLINIENGEVLWSSFQEETLAMGQKIANPEIERLKKHNEKMKEALEFWQLTFNENGNNVIECCYSDSDRHFKPFNQLMRTKEALEFLLTEPPKTDI